MALPAPFLGRYSGQPARAAGWRGHHKAVKAEKVVPWTDAGPRGKSASPTAGPRLLGAKAAAEYLGVPYTSLRDIAHRGHIPVVRVPDCRRWWFDRRDLDRAVEAWKETREDF